MTTESSQHKIDRAKGAEPTQVLDATARKKYIRSIQRRQQDGNQAVSQTNLSATTDVYNAKQYSAFRNLVSQVMLSAFLRWVSSFQPEMNRRTFGLWWHRFLR